MTPVNHTRIITFAIDTSTEVGNEAMNLLLESASHYPALAVEVRSAVGHDVIEVKIVALDHLITQDIRDLFTEMSDYIVSSVVATDDVE